MSVIRGVDGRILLKYDDSDSWIASEVPSADRLVPMRGKLLNSWLTVAQTREAQGDAKGAGDARAAAHAASVSATAHQAAAQEWDKVATRLGR